jgi:hypothetical protein
MLSLYSDDFSLGSFQGSREIKRPENKEKIVLSAITFTRTSETFFCTSQSL